MSNQPNVFFFSLRCKHCKEAYELIQKIGISKFVFQNIDEIEEIPPIIDRVPCLLSNEKQMYTEEGLFTYLNSLLNVEPFMIKEMGKSMSDNYSYMDNSGAQLSHEFQFLNGNNTEFKIVTPSEGDMKKIINYDQFLAERDNDLKTMNR